MPITNTICIYKWTHLGMSYSSTGTDGQDLSCFVKDCLDYFYIYTKIIFYNSDDSGNLLTWKRALDHMADNSDILNPKQTIFEKLCIAHVYMLIVKHL